MRSKGIANMPILGSYKRGGKVKKTGLYKLHKGEHVDTVKTVKRDAMKKAKRKSPARHIATSKSGKKFVRGKGVIKPHKSFYGGDKYNPAEHDMDWKHIKSDKHSGKKLTLNQDGSRIAGTILGTYKGGQPERTYVIAVGKKKKFTTVDRVSDEYKIHTK